MNLDDYEKATDIEIKEPADIYRAMLDGCVAQFESQVVKELHYFDGNRFRVLNFIGSKMILQSQIDAGHWTLWRKKPKKEWWELVSLENPYLVRRKDGYLYVKVSDSAHTDYTPLTDAEIDQLKRGYGNN